MKKYFIGYYNPSVIVTYIGLLSSFLAIYMAWNQKTGIAVCLLLFSGFCDTIDGRIARMVSRTETEKCFGGQLDFLCDVVSFGVTPAVIGVAMYQGSILEILGIVAGFCITLAAVIRLAYFNVEEEQIRSGDREKRQSYRGLPVTNSAYAVPAAYCIGSLLPFPMALPIVCSVVLFLTAFLFILNFRVPVVHGKAIWIIVVFGLALFLTIVFVVGV
ncbi:MAG: CDP-alcohol phosphatidyltransferase family protein [Clostridiales bacterium]|nr:CDP-alcohol phosphatidyltransferase family protein [Clostridiales bacterium]